MSALNAMLDSPLAYHLGWTLVHFLWQGALLGVLYRIMRHLTADAAPEIRYWLSLGSLAALAALPVITFIHLSNAATMPSIAPGSWSIAASAGGPAREPLLVWLRELLRPLVPWTVPAWSTGVALMSLKSYVGWRKANLLTRHASHEAPPIWQENVQRLAVAVGVRIRVQLTVTARVAVPCVVGWIRPVILLPPSALTGLTPLQLEMVLAHELAHIRRHDYLINLLQISVETLLFYHPVVRWVSRDARNERELCCDDSAVHACGNALHYAHALADLAALRSVGIPMALGAAGGELTLRVERLITPHYSSAQQSPRLNPLMLASVIFLSGLLMLASAHQTGVRPAVIPVLLPAAMLPTHAIHALSGTEAMPSLPLVPTELPVSSTPVTTHAETMRAIDPAPPIALGMVVPPQTVESDTVGLGGAVTAPAVEESVDDIGAFGAPLSTYTGQTGTPDLHENKRAIAQLKVIGVNGVDSDQQATTRHHDYCEPITGSRVCR